MAVFLESAYEISYETREHLAEPELSTSHSLDPDCDTSEARDSDCFEIYSDLNDANESSFNDFDDYFAEDSAWQLTDGESMDFMEVDAADDNQFGGGTLDEDFTEGTEEYRESDDNPRNEPIARLESMVLSVLTQLSAVPSRESRIAAPGKITLELRDRRKTSQEKVAVRSIVYPKKAPGPSAKPLAQLLKVIDLMHEALVDDVPTTKRDMYYKDVSLFKSQSVVDRLVDDIAATFEMGRSDLHVRASCKGLISGVGLTMHLNEGEVLHVNATEPTLIPISEDISHFEVDDSLAWVLVVEKEAVFQTLCRLNITAHPLLPGPGLLITGKGYPDVATRQLVKTLSDNLPPSIPILCLVDGDAYGIDILSVYKRGSTSMLHERDKLAAGRVRWLGLWTSELAGLGIDRDALIPMTKHDEKKAMTMLRRPDLPRKWRKELQYMLHNRRKAEIEILSTTNSCHNQAPEDQITVGDQAADAVTQPPLLQYLIKKIAAYMADCAQKYAKPEPEPEA